MLVSGPSIIEISSSLTIIMFQLTNFCNFVAVSYIPWFASCLNNIGDLTVAALRVLWNIVSILES